MSDKKLDSTPLLDKATATEIAREMVTKFCPFQYSPMAMAEQPDLNNLVFRAHEWLIDRLSNTASERPLPAGDKP